MLYEVITVMEANQVQDSSEWTIGVQKRHIFLLCLLPPRFSLIHHEQPVNKLQRECHLPRNVITSYSIHYTKLYEWILRFRQQIWKR